MKAILVGAGGMGRAWARNLVSNPETEIAAWVDVVPGQVEQSSQEVGIEVPAFVSLSDALRAVEADFVVDVSVPEAHEAVTIEALEAGLPVLGEKPMSVSMESARRMVAASERAGKLYMVSQSRRYDGRQEAFKQILGEIGELGILNVDFYIGAHFGGFRDKMAHVLVLDMAIHTFDQARYLSGLDPVSVYADEFNPGWSWYQDGSSITCLFEMTGGVRFAYRGSWCSEGLHTSWEGEWRAVGSKGTVKWNGHDLIEAETVVGDEGFHRPVERQVFQPIDKLGGIAGSLDEFLWALRTGNAPNGECHDNIKSLAMVFGAIESAETGLRVEIAL
ncbi:MAG: gfo/Idh/MocA family oxidoreductase [Armatimonadetes bacterium]|nr:gfo/Idh/MocA family oxidoreductase [Armatimonadota bacterium]